MKTLDEVIKSYELQMGEKRCEDCSYCDDCYDHHSCECPYRDADALHYLKEYRMQLDDIVAKRKVLEYKTAQYEQMCDTVQKQGQEHEDRLQAEIARYLEAVKNCEDVSLKAEKVIIDAVRNDPLTWDELKQMEGKPVYVELLSHDMFDDPSHRVDSDWWVIGEVRKDDIIAACYLDEMELCEEDLGNTWQAYRKERE